MEPATPLRSGLAIATAVAVGAVESVANLAEHALDAAAATLGRRRPDDAAPLTGRTAVITGGNAGAQRSMRSGMRRGPKHKLGRRGCHARMRACNRAACPLAPGIGFALAQKMAARGAHVVLACRSEARGRAAAEVRPRPSTAAAAGMHAPCEAAGAAPAIPHRSERRRPRPLPLSRPRPTAPSATRPAHPPSCPNPRPARPQAIGRVTPLPGCSRGSVAVERVDLSDLGSVRAFARRLGRRRRPPHYLICNAGALGRGAVLGGGGWAVRQGCP